MGWNVITGGGTPLFPDSTKSIMSEKKIGNKNVGNGESHHFYGKTGENAVRFGTKGAKNPNHIGIWVTPIGRFESLSIASDATGLCKSAVFYRCVKSQKFMEWHFVANEENNDN